MAHKVMRPATGVLLLVATSAVAQDLDPRAYAKVPVGFTIAIAGVSFSSGGVLTDPTLPVENVHADVWTPSVGIAQSFGLFGRTAQTLVALPYSWAHVTGDVAEQVQQVDRSGLSDMRLRFSMLLAGAPAMTPQQFASSPRRPIVGASLTVAAPSGQYYPKRLINLGTNRWSFKPEVALSYPIGRAVACRCLRRALAVRRQRVVLSRHRASHAGADRRAANARQLFTLGEGVGRLRRDVVCRRTDVGGRRPPGASRVELARRRDAGLSGRQPARHQGRRQHRRDHPVRGRLQHRLGGMADGLVELAAGAGAGCEVSSGIGEDYETQYTMAQRSPHVPRGHRSRGGRDECDRVLEPAAGTGNIQAGSAPGNAQAGGHRHRASGRRRRAIFPECRSDLPEPAFSGASLTSTPATPSTRECSA